MTADSVEPVDGGIQRWALEAGDVSGRWTTMRPNPRGPFVLHSKHLTELERVRNETHQQWIDALTLVMRAGYSDEAIILRFLDPPDPAGFFAWAASLGQEEGQQ